MEGGDTMSITREALIAWARRWQSVREDMAKADHCDHEFNQSEADHFAALRAALEAEQTCIDCGSHHIMTTEAMLDQLNTELEALLPAPPVEVPRG